MAAQGRAAVVWLTRDSLLNEDLFPPSIPGSLYMP